MSSDSPKPHVDDPPVALRSLGGRISDAAATVYRRWLVTAAVIIGAALRTREWLYGKSLWLDELTVTENLATRDYAGLLRPLSGNQGAPVGWLWLERTSINLFGVNELSLRLVPWLASLVALLVFPAVSRKLIGDVAAPAAVALFALAPSLIYFSAETKRYPSDVACGLLIVLLTAVVAERKSSLRDAVSWGAACGTLVWFSQAAILVAAACGLFLAIRWLRNWRDLANLCVAAAILCLSVALQWVFILKDLAANATLQSYWQGFGGFPPVPSTPAAITSWLGTSATTFYRQVAQDWLPWIAVLIAAWGLAVLVRRRPWSAALLALIVGTAIAAAIAHQYPLAQRLALYLLPIAILLMCGALEDAVPHQRHNPADRRRQLTALIVGVALIVVSAGSVFGALGKFAHPDETTAGRQSIEFVAEHQQPGDLILVEAGAASAMKFYGPRIGVRADGVFRFDRPKSAGNCADVATVTKKAERVWLVLGHHFTNQPANRTAVYLSQLGEIATPIASFAGAGDAGAYLFDLTHPPAVRTPPLKSWVPGGCFTVHRVSDSNPATSGHG